MEFDMKSSYNEEEKRWEIKVSGEIDIFNSNNFKEDINKLLEKNQADLFIDCSKLKYIDSTALAALVALLKNVRAYNGEMRLVNVGSNMSRLFRITNLDKAFMIEGEGNDRKR